MTNVRFRFSCSYVDNIEKKRQLNGCFMCVKKCQKEEKQPRKNSSNVLMNNIHSILKKVNGIFFLVSKKKRNG
jgi:hypothetical protein